MLSKNQIKWVHSLELKKNRKKEGLFVAEGPKVVGDLQRAGYVARALFSTTERPNAQLITDDELRKLSFLQHPQEVLAVFEIPKTSQFSIPNCEATTLNSKLLTLNSSLSLALDGVQDPGNLGTIIRIADWFGIETIYCSEDTADCYNPKVVQATMGSLAHVHIVYTNLEALTAPCSTVRTSTSRSSLAKESSLWATRAMASPQPFASLSPTSCSFPTTTHPARRPRASTSPSLPPSPAPSSVADRIDGK